MPNNGGHTVPRITKSEHIGPDDTGDNIMAKRVATYIFNPSTNNWERDGADVIPMATRVDDTTTANITYIGKAPIGSATSSAVWQIAKLDTTSGVVKTWADSDANYDNIWTDRVSLNYG